MGVFVAEDLQNWQLLEETPETFVVQHADGTALPIAKQYTDPNQHNLIRSLASQQAAAAPEQSFGSKFGEQTGQVEGLDTFAQKEGLTPRRYGTHGQKPQEILGQPQAPTLQEAPKVSGVKWGSVGGGPRPAGQDQLGKTGAPEEQAQSDLRGALRQQERAVQEKEKADVEAAGAEVKAYDAMVPQMEQIMKEGQERRNRLLNTAEKFLVDLNSPENQIDPHRFWNEKSTGNKILSTIFIALGGGPGGTNQAMDVLNKQIERDLLAQKEKRDQKNTLFGKTLEMVKSYDEAEAATRMNMLTLAETQIKQAASRTKSAQAKLNAKEMVTKIKEQQAKIAEDYSKKFMANKIAAGLATQEEILRYGDPEKMVQTKTGIKQAFDKDAAKKAREAVSMESSATDLAKEYADLLKEGGSYGLSERKAKSDSIHNQGVILIKNAAELGVLAGPDVKIAEGMLPGLNTPLSGNSLVKLKQLEKFIRSQYNAKMKANIPGYSGETMKAQSGRPMSVKGEE
jgi:hypothetical protein